MTKTIQDSWFVIC